VNLTSETLSVVNSTIDVSTEVLQVRAVGGAAGWSS
jgi:hypothetical protein